jgi:hypothetical protein
MKNQIPVITLLLLGLSITALSGQETKFILSAEGGPSLTSLYRNGTIRKDFKPITGGYAGILVQYNFTGNFSLRSGITYERTGTNFYVVTYDIYADYIYRFDYVSIPVMVRAEYGKNVRFYMNAGPYFSYLCNQEYVSRNRQEFDDQIMQIHGSTPGNKNRIDYGLAGGIGINIRIAGNAAISAGVTVYLGLCNTKKQPVYYNSVEIPVSTQTSSYNNSAIFLVGFSVNMGKSK